MNILKKAVYKKADQMMQRTINEEITATNTPLPPCPFPYWLYEPTHPSRQKETTYSDSKLRE